MRIKDERLAWAEAKLHEYQRIALRYFGGSVRVERKADRSPVTIADRTIEERLRRDLERAFPRDVVVGEEFGASATGATSFWTIDPIDGTRAFSRGLPSWGMLLGRIERGQPVLGACLYPAFKTFVGVGRGTPAYERSNGRHILLRRAVLPPVLGDAVIFHGGFRWWVGTRYAGGFQRLVKSCYLERAYGDCYAYLWVLRGKADAMVDYSVKVWDIVPFAALARATGRVVTDFSNRGCWTGPESVMAHPRLAKQINTVLQAGTPTRYLVTKWRG